MPGKVPFWIAALALTAGLCALSYQAGVESARSAASPEADKLRAETDVLRKRHDAAVEGLAQAEQQLRLSQQEYAELSAALDVSREQMTRMREELDVVRRALEARSRAGTPGKSPRGDQ